MKSWTRFQSRTIRFLTLKRRAADIFLEKFFKKFCWIGEKVKGNPTYIYLRAVARFTVDKFRLRIHIKFVHGQMKGECSSTLTNRCSLDPLHIYTLFHPLILPGFLLFFGASPISRSAGHKLSRMQPPPPPTQPS